MSGGPVGRQARRPRIRLAKGGRGFRPETSCGSVTWSQANRAAHRRYAEDQPQRARCGEGRGRRRREGVSTVRGGRTRRRRSPGGARIGRSSNRFRRHRTLRGEQGPEAEGGGAGAGQTAGASTKTARGHDSAGESRYGSAERDKPLKGKPWTRLRGETNPQGRWRSKPSRTCETSRTERQLGEWDLRASVDAACWCRDEGTRTPREALSGLRTVARSFGVRRAGSRSSNSGGGGKLEGG